MVPMAFLGIGSLVVLAARAWIDVEDLKLLLCGAFIPLFGFVSVAVMFRFTREIGLYDNNLLRLDEILTGTHPSFAIGRFLEVWPSLQNVFLLVYDALPLPLALMLALGIRYP